MKKKEGMQNLFNYIKAISKETSKYISNIKNESYYLFLKDIPQNENVFSKYMYSKNDNCLENDDNYSVILKIEKPVNKNKFPEIPPKLIDWIDIDNNNLDKYVNLKNKINIIDNNNKVEINFLDDDERVLIYEQWNEKYLSWKKNYKNFLKTNDLFYKLHSLYTELQRDSEKFEIILGQGILKVKNKNIFYPIITKKLSLSYDLEYNSMVISMIDSNIEINNSIVQQLDIINKDFIKELQQEIETEDYDLFDNKKIVPFLKKFANSISIDTIFKDGIDNEYFSDDIILYNEPIILFREKNIGIIKFIDDIIEDIEENNNINNIFKNLVGNNVKKIEKDNELKSFSDSIAEVYGEDKNILLSKPANREQLEIAKKIELYDTVLVQGPPGTGKTHTIANLIGHFLSQGKSVLVTSYTKKALLVLKEKVAEELQKLCVSLLNDNNDEMEKTINNIIDYTASVTLSELKNNINILKDERDNTIKELAYKREKIFALKNKEYETIIIGGNGYSIKEIAEFVKNNEKLLEYIPGEIDFKKEFPLNISEFKFLCSVNTEISKQDEVEMKNLISTDILMNIETFKNLVNRKQELISDINKKHKLYFRKINMTIEEKIIKVNNSELFSKFDLFISNKIKNIISNNKNNLLSWNINAIIDGKNGGGFKENWIQLINSIEDTFDYSSKVSINLLGYESNLPDDIINIENVNLLKEIFNYVKSGKKINNFSLIFKPEWKKLLTKFREFGQNFDNIEYFENTIAFMELYIKRKNLKKLYVELIEKNEGDLFSKFGNKPEQNLKYIIEDISFYINWYDNYYLNVESLLGEMCFNWDFIDKDFSSIDSEVKTKFYFLYNDLNHILDLAEIVYCEIKNINKEFNLFKEKLMNFNNLNSKIYNNLIAAIENENIDLYMEVFNELIILNEKYKNYLKKERLLNVLEKVAPDFANEFRLKKITYFNEDIFKVWKCKQFSLYLDEIISEPFEDLQRDVEILSNRLRIQTSKMAELFAWYYLKEKIDEDISQKQALQGFKQTIKKIGKGTGKNANKLKLEAKKLMSKCQRAVPVWIMTISKALESLDPKINKFDIIIVDEASQADLKALPIIYLGKKIIVVGDDEQVSPTSMAITSEKLDNLKNMYIKNIIPNYHLYDLETSLYDIMSQNAPTLMLKEHFRCLPDIINYSNKLSYNYKIKPLRESNSINIKPSIISYRVNGKRNLNSKINKVEAENIVALILACINRKEYENMTFGVISLKGDEQVKLINNLLFEKIPLSEINKRNILCGTASNFQGDERDIIFISLVDSNQNSETPLMLQSIERRNLKQRYNVAFSRAKNQIWIVHSLDINKDLKQGDIRRDLLEYAENPKSFINKKIEIEKKSDSYFETEVANYLFENGYNIVQQWEVGTYKIDIVAIHNNMKIAIECDGETYHSGEEKVKKDMERQAILERIGWKFIRIRGSEYFRNPETTMINVCKKLEEYGIFKSDFNNDNNTNIISDLQKDLQNESIDILNNWTS